VAEDTVKKWAVVNMVMNLQVPWNFFTGQGTFDISRYILLHGVIRFVKNDGRDKLPVHVGDLRAHISMGFAQILLNNTVVKTSKLT
jgi:hypothetical protein